MKQVFIPAWKDDKQNRFVVIAKNHLFDTLEEASTYQLHHFIDYILFGWTCDGIYESAIDEVTGQAFFPHVPGTGSYGCSVAIIDGPIYQEALEL